MSEQQDQLSHLDANGRASMVDVGDKEVTARRAVATATVTMKAATLALLEANELKKGDAFSVSRIAAIQAAKRTSDLIPLCHPLPLTHVDVSLTPDASLPGVRISVSCRVSGKTGVEMEALTAASVAALTIYDMAKGVDRSMVISDIVLREKTGGKSGDWVNDDNH